MDRPCLRPDLVRSDQGEHLILKDPVSGRFFRAGPAERTILGLLDGTRTPEEVRAQCGLDVELAVLQGFLAQLDRLGFFGEPQALSPMTPRSTILCWRLASVNPERILVRLAPWARPFFSGTFVVLALGSIFSALVVLPGREATSISGLGAAFGLWIAVGAMFLLHESAHGIACTHFGGRVREAGFMILCFLPCFYTNVSDAWLFPRRAHRIWVMLAGVFFEAFLWSLAVLPWRITSPDSTLHAAALAVVLSSGASILFNLNPLIKLDGYYVLSDLLGLPNLRTRSLGYVGWRIREWMTGRRVLEPIPAREGRIYWIYGITAVTYTVLLVITMVFFLGRYLVGTFGGVGAALFVFILVAAFRSPVYFLGNRIMSTAKEMTRKPGRRRLLVAISILAAGLVLSAFLRGELRVTGPCEVRPMARSSVRTPIGGLLREVLVRQGQSVRKNEPLARLDDRPLRADHERAQARLAEAKAELDRLRKGPRREEIERAEKRAAASKVRLEFAERKLEKYSKDDSTSRLQLDQYQAERDLAEKELQQAESELALVRAGSRPEEIAAAEARVRGFEVDAAEAARRLGQAELLAPFDGVVLSERPEEKSGRQLTAGDEVCEVAATSEMEVEIRIPEKEVSDVPAGAEIEIKLLAWPEATFHGRVVGIAPTAAGEGTRSVLVRSRLPNDGRLRPGLSGEARILCGRRTYLGLFARKAVRIVRVEFWW